METKILALQTQTKDDIVDPEHLATFIGQRMKKWRTFREITQVQLATMTGLTRQTVSNVEKGATMSIHTIYLMARAMGMPLEKIFPDYEVMEDIK